jgi:transcriptional regulator with XRE-family HTH domain
MRTMSDVAVGRALRAIRIHLGLRQADVAIKAGVAQQLVSRIERGDSGRMARQTVGRVLEAVGADVVTVVRWRGGQLDRLLDEGHAALVGLTADLLRRHGWQVLTEVTYAEWGERGSIDILAWHAATRRLLVVEIKTEIASAEELLRRHDEKVRLGPKLARDRFGVAPRSVSRLLVLGDRTSNRTRLARLEASVGATYPARSAAVKQWIADQSTTAALHGLLLLREPDRARHGVRRVRRERPARAAPPPTDRATSTDRLTVRATHSGIR